VRGGEPGHGLTAGERSVLGHLDESALVASLAQLVRIPSVGGSDAEVEVQEVAAGMLDDLGADVDRWDVDLDELSVDSQFPGVEVAGRCPVAVTRLWRWCSRATSTSYPRETRPAGWAPTRSPRRSATADSTGAGPAT
jgi:hypothetical protein